MSRKFQRIRRRWLAGGRSDQEIIAANIEYRLSLAFIQAHRKAGFTRRDIAQRTGISVDTISRIENGKIQIIRQLDSLARGSGLRLEVSLESLCPEENRSSGQP